MNRVISQIWSILPILGLVFVAGQIDGQELRKDTEKGPGAEKPAAKSDPAVIAKLIQQLASASFKAREEASKELAKLDEVPDALREAAKSADADVANRAQIAIAIVTDRVEEKALQAMIRDLNKVELDRFVRKMVTDEKFAGDKQREIIQAIAKAVTKEANRLGERKYGMPDLDVKAMSQMFFNGETKNPGYVHEKALLSAGPTPYITVVSKSIVIVDGDFTGATGIDNSLLIVNGDFTGATGVDNSLLIVRGNVGYVTSVNNSVILATGDFEGATGYGDSFLQVNNHQIRFTGSSGSVLIKTQIRTTGGTNSRVLDVDKGPLQLSNFSAPKGDDQLVWGRK